MCVHQVVRVPSLISLTVSLDVKHHVYLLVTVFVLRYVTLCGRQDLESVQLLTSLEACYVLALKAIILLIRCIGMCACACVCVCVCVCVCELLLLLLLFFRMRRESLSEII